MEVSEPVLGSLEPRICHTLHIVRPVKVTQIDAVALISL